MVDQHIRMIGASDKDNREIAFPADFVKNPTAFLKDDMAVSMKGFLSFRYGTLQKIPGKFPSPNAVVVVG